MATRRLNKSIKQGIVRTAEERLMNSARPDFTIVSKMLYAAGQSIIKELLPDNYDELVESFMASGAVRLRQMEVEAICIRDVKHNLVYIKLPSHRMELLDHTELRVFNVLEALGGSSYIESSKVLNQDDNGVFDVRRCYLNAVQFTMDHKEFKQRFSNEIRLIKHCTKQLDDMVGQLDDRMLLVKQLVNRSTTVKTLLEKWPEAKDLIPKDDVADESNLPAIIDPGLNEALGIPIKEETSEAA
jgi:hypothetical protein